MIIRGNYARVGARGYMQNLLVANIKLLLSSCSVALAVSDCTTPWTLRKYDPILRKHVVFTETKKNLGRNEVKEKKR